MPTGRAAVFSVADRGAYFWKALLALFLLLAATVAVVLYLKQRRPARYGSTS